MTAIAHYPSAATPVVRRVHITHWILMGLVVFAGTIDASRIISFGTTSGLGAATFGSVGLICALWLTVPVNSRPTLRTTLCLFLFVVWTAGTLFWSSPGMLATQLMLVYLGFLGLIWVTAREVSRDPSLARKLFNTVLVSSAIPTLAYSYTVFTGHKGEDGLVAPRAFALYAMTPVAVALATWRRPNPRARQPWQPLAWALFVTLIVYGSLSRTALVCCLIMYPLAVALRMSAKSVLTAVVLLVVGTSGLVTAVLTNQELYDRFFKNDAAIKVGGVKFNASGRTKIWAVVINGFRGTPDWVFGNGVAGSEVLINSHFNNIGHPHNDYLRFTFDQGFIGLGLFLLFVAALAARTLANLRRSARFDTPDYRYHLAVTLVLVALLISMFTDNAVCYSFVMFPLAVVIGCSLAAGERTGQLGPADPVLFAFPVVTTLESRRRRPDTDHSTTHGH